MTSSELISGDFLGRECGFYLVICAPVRKLKQPHNIIIKSHAHQHEQ